LFTCPFFLLSLITLANAAKDEPCKAMYEIYTDECADIRLIGQRHCEPLDFAHVNMNNYEYYIGSVNKDTFDVLCKKACQGGYAINYESFRNQVCVKRDQKKSKNLKNTSKQISIREESKEILLNGRTIWKEEDAFGIGMQKLFKLTDEDVALIGVNSGGTACPMLYRFLTVKKDGKYVLSKQFGSCSDQPQIQSKGNKIIVKFPVRYKKYDTVIYEAGRITDNGKLVGVEIQSK